MLKRSMLLQKAKNFISNILVLNKYVSNTDLRWKTISVLFPTKGFTQRPYRKWPENLTSPQEQKKVCYLPLEVCGEVSTTGLLPCSVQEDIRETAQTDCGQIAAGKTRLHDGWCSVPARTTSAESTARSESRCFIGY